MDKSMAITEDARDKWVEGRRKEAAEDGQGMWVAMLDSIDRPPFFSVELQGHKFLNRGLSNFLGLVAKRIEELERKVKQLEGNHA